MENGKRVSPKSILLSAAIVVLLAGCVVLGIQIGDHYADRARAEARPSYRTFADWTDRAELQDVPAMLVEHSRIEDACDYGDGTYGIVVDGTGLSDYRKYLETVGEAGFTKYADNGEKGLEGAIYTASFTKDDLTLTVTQMINDEKTYILASPELPLSEHLRYDESYVAADRPGKKTRVHMLELFSHGNSFIFELKNGHFIINDGGLGTDLAHLLDYLTSLVPQGEIPVVEAWILSHEHSDHINAFLEFLNRPEDTARIFVNGIYWNPPSREVFAAFDQAAYESVSAVKIIAKLLRTSEGAAPQVYRMESGQRYYFDDVTIDVLFTQEQLRKVNYYEDLNDSSIWLMYTMDGEKFLLCGDADRGSVWVVMRTFDSDYFDLEAFVTFHHGINLWYDFTDYLKNYEIAIWPNYRAGSMVGTDRYTEFSKYINERAKESFGWGNGTVVWEFPYEVGTAEFKPLVDWTKYTAESRRNEDGQMHSGIWVWVDDFEAYIKNYE